MVPAAMFGAAALQSDGGAFARAEARMDPAVRIVNKHELR